MSGRNAVQLPTSTEDRARRGRSKARGERRGAQRPQSNGIVERLHRTLVDEHFRVEGRPTWFETIAEMQTVLDAYLVEHNSKRPHQGRGMTGRTPVNAFTAGIRKENNPQPKPTKKAAA